MRRQSQSLGHLLGLPSSEGFIDCLEDFRIGLDFSSSLEQCERSTSGQNAGRGTCRTPNIRLRMPQIILQSILQNDLRDGDGMTGSLDPA